MATVGAVALGLAARLETIDGLRVTDFVPGGMVPPACFLQLGEMLEDTWGYETMEVPFQVVVLVSSNSMRVGQRSLYDLATAGDPGSVWNVIADDPTLGLAGTHARIVRYRPLGFEEIAAIGYLGGMFETLVTTPGAF